MHTDTTATAATTQHKQLLSSLQVTTNILSALKSKPKTSMAEFDVGILNVHDLLQTRTHYPTAVSVLLVVFGILFIVSTCGCLAYCTFRLCVNRAGRLYRRETQSVGSELRSLFGMRPTNHNPDPPTYYQATFHRPTNVHHVVPGGKTEAGPFASPCQGDQARLHFQQTPAHAPVPFDGHPSRHHGQAVPGAPAGGQPLPAAGSGQPSRAAEPTGYPGNATTSSRPALFS